MIWKQTEFIVKAFGNTLRHKGHPTAPQCCLIRRQGRSPSLLLTRKDFGQVDQTGQKYSSVIGIAVLLWVAARRPDLMGGYVYPRHLAALGLVAWLVTIYLGWESVGRLATLFR